MSGTRSFDQKNKRRSLGTVAYYLHKVSVKKFMHKHLHLILGEALAPRQKFRAKPGKVERMNLFGQPIL